MFFDRFDICEAYHCLEFDFNSGGILQERHHSHSVGYQLNRMDFRISPAFQGYNSLTENGKDIYNNFIASHM